MSLFNLNFFRHKKLFRYHIWVLFVVSMWDSFNWGKLMKAEIYWRGRDLTSTFFCYTFENSSLPKAELELGPLLQLMYSSLSKLQIVLPVQLPVHCSDTLCPSSICSLTAASTMSPPLLEIFFLVLRVSGKFLKDITKNFQLIVVISLLTLWKPRFLAMIRGIYKFLILELM